MRAAVPPEHRRITFRQAFAARLGGEAISFLTFTGPLSARLPEVALLRKRVPLTYGVPATRCRQPPLQFVGCVLRSEWRLCNVS